jgi:hypothetical protein
MAVGKKHGAEVRVQLEQRMTSVTICVVFTLDAPIVKVQGRNINRGQNFVELERLGLFDLQFSPLLERQRWGKKISAFQDLL